MMPDRSSTLQPADSLVEVRLAPPEAGTVALHGEGHGLAVHQRREGDEHAYHGSKRTSLGDGRSASGRKWPEGCTAKALGRQPCAPNFRELRYGEVCILGFLRSSQVRSSKKF